jgi:hypothetical protein
MSSASESRRIRHLSGMPAFLERLLARESGIRVDQFEWYRDNIDTPMLCYPEVVSIGVPRRDFATGDLVKRCMTVREYFATLGVDHLFCASDPSCVRAMQYASINALGFVGYQFGEAILFEHGYYNPPRVWGRAPDGCSSLFYSYYIGPISCWSGDERQRYHLGPDGRKPVIATASNTWAGRFSGKNGVRCLEDLRTVQAQETIIREVLKKNLALIQAQLRLTPRRMREYFPADRLVSLYRDFPPITLRCTISGAIAAAHLCGVPAVVDLLTTGIVKEDEFGTSIVDYINEFSGFDLDVLLGA